MNTHAEERAATFTVLDAGLLTTLQDAGRPGHAHLGVPRSGFLDRASAQFANRLVGNPEDAAVLETTATGVRLRVELPCTVAVTGARADVMLAPVEQPGRSVVVGQDEAVEVPAGTVLHVGAAREGLRTYLAVAGGLLAEPVLGSVATDLLSGLGPAPLREGDPLHSGEMIRPVPPTAGLLPHGVMGARPRPEVWELRVLPGPRHDWLEAAGLERSLLENHGAVEFTASATSNRIGLRLEGATVARRAGEVASEPMVLGAVQIPPSGEPVIFLADHPTTGGYPVVWVVHPDDLDLCARIRPGERVRLLPSPLRPLSPRPR